MINVEVVSRMDLRLQNAKVRLLKVIYLFNLEFITNNCITLISYLSLCVGLQVQVASNVALIKDEQDQKTEEKRNCGMIQLL